MILRPMVKLRNLSEQFHNCWLCVDNVTEGVVSQIDFCDKSLPLELPMSQLVVPMALTRAGDEYYSVQMMKHF